MKCPGQDMQFWKPGDIYEAQCPDCGRPVEFFKDDTARRCGSCGHRFANPKMDFGCAAYCPYAEQCLGDLPPELVAQQDRLLKDRIAVEVKRFYGRDFSRIGRATRAARHAEILYKTEGGDLAVILSTVYLREVDDARMERDDPDSAGRDSSSDGTAAAAKILRKLKAGDGMIDAVTALLASDQAVTADASLEARIVHDALALGEAEAILGKCPEEANGIHSRLKGSLLTEAGLTQAEGLIRSATETSL
ncbi:MAG: phosphohydrolase [Desulfobacterales bacterium]